MALLPVQSVLAVPVEMLRGGGDYLRGLRQAQADERAARARMAALAERAARTEQLAQENAACAHCWTCARRRAGALADGRSDVRSGRSLFTQGLLDRGSQHGVALGAPVINEAGVVGQVTRAFALTSEVTLLVDKDAAIPVINTRTQQRSAAFGGGGVGPGGMELRFVSGHADVQVGDLLQTSGLDGVYPPGLPVARVSSVERRAEAGFARIGLMPVAPPDGVRHVLVLEPSRLQLPPPPELAAAEPGKADRQLSSPGRRPASSP
jgi:rod shape-determining protein MreC